MLFILFIWLNFCTFRFAALSWIRSLIFPSLLYHTYQLNAGKPPIFILIFVGFIRIFSSPKPISEALLLAVSRMKREETPKILLHVIETIISFQGSEWRIHLGIRAIIFSGLIVFCFSEIDPLYIFSLLLNFY